MNNAVHLQLSRLLAISFTNQKLISLYKKTKCQSQIDITLQVNVISSSCQPLEIHRVSATGGKPGKQILTHQMTSGVNSFTRLIAHWSRVTVVSRLSLFANHEFPKQ
jgi:hypothetical protein